jgi:hypothetical protein
MLKNGQKVMKFFNFSKLDLSPSKVIELISSLRNQKYFNVLHRFNEYLSYFKISEGNSYRNTVSGEMHNLKINLLIFLSFSDA